MSETHYDVLGVEATVDKESLKKAYRRLAFAWHPDRHNGSNESTERFKRVAEAYAVLSDPHTRSQYDALLNSGDTSEETPTVDAETAAAMFFTEMLGLAAELTLQNIPWSRIVPELIGRGCPENVATQIAQGVENQRKEAVRKAAEKAFIRAFFWCALGVIVTAASYSSARPGGSYLITTGLFIFGGWNMLRAVFYLMTGRAP